MVRHPDQDARAASDGGTTVPAQPESVEAGRAVRVERDDLPVEDHRPSGEMGGWGEELRERLDEAPTVPTPKGQAVRGDRRERAPAVPLRLDREPRRINESARLVAASIGAIQVGGDLDLDPVLLTPV